MGWSGRGSSLTTNNSVYSPMLLTGSRRTIDDFSAQQLTGSRLAVNVFSAMQLSAI